MTLITLTHIIFLARGEGVKSTMSTEWRVFNINELNINKRAFINNCFYVEARRCLSSSEGVEVAKVRGRSTRSV